MCLCCSGLRELDAFHSALHLNAECSSWSLCSTAYSPDWSLRWLIRLKGEDQWRSLCSPQMHILWLILPLYQFFLSDLLHQCDSPSRRRPLRPQTSSRGKILEITCPVRLWHKPSSVSVCFCLSPSVVSELGEDEVRDPGLTTSWMCWDTGAGAQRRTDRAAGCVPASPHKGKHRCSRGWKSSFRGAQEQKLKGQRTSCHSLDLTQITGNIQNPWRWCHDETQQLPANLSRYLLPTWP